LLSNYSTVCQALAGCGAGEEEAFDEAVNLCVLPWLVVEGKEQLLEGDSSFARLVKRHLS
jgi:hypothetical protein